MLSGCYLKSVHPLITKEQAILQHNLDGVYENAGQRWTFASDNNPAMIAELIRRYEDEDISIDPGDEDSLGFNGYLVLVEDLTEEAENDLLFIAMAGEISGQVFLNLKVFDLSFQSGSDFKDSQIFFVNTFSRLTISDDGISMEPFASKWIRNQIRDNRVRIKHEKIQNEFDEGTEILVTAANRELRKFVEKYGDTEDAYEDPINLKRMNNGIQ